MGIDFQTALAVLTTLVSVANALAACSNTLAPKNGAPVVAEGYQVRLIANGLIKPRGLIVDSGGHLLAVQTGVGITSFTLKEDEAGCVSIVSKLDVATTLGVSIFSSYARMCRGR